MNKSKIDEIIESLKSMKKSSEYDYGLSTETPGCRWPADAKEDEEIISLCDSIIKKLEELKKYV